MKTLLPLLLWLALIPSGFAAGDAAPGDGQGFQALCYHEVHDDVRDHADPYAVDAAELVAQFSWLREHGYHAVSLNDILVARQGGKPLPEKAILLTFDDGYRSVYTKVFPLLKLFNYPAVIGLVGNWMEAGADEKVPYEDRLLPRSHFMSWEQVKEMADSGLVEVASHSYDLHRGIPANPQGNLEPAATARLYDAVSGSYEDDKAYLARIRADLGRNSDLIERRTGARPRALVWPYGSYNLAALDIAKELGMPITLNLEDGRNGPRQPLDQLRRTLVSYNPRLPEFIPWLHESARPRPVRVVHVDLDYVYDTDPAQQEKNLGLLLDRIKAFGVSTVYLQAYADPDGNGAADALYFPNRHLPVRTDLFNRVAWQLRTRAGVEVFAWMPVLAFEFGKNHPATQLQVQVFKSSGPSGGQGYPRLSPFSPEARRIVAEIYEDLAKHADFAGILFHDDATLNDFEDASPWAVDVYSRQWGLPASLGKIRANPELMRHWTRRKTQALIDWTQALADRVRQYRAPLKTARNLYARVAMEPESELWFAQSLPLFLESYDYTAVMAMPYMEQAGDARAWLNLLVEKVARIPGAMDKTVFELQSVDWNRQAPVSTAMLAGQMRQLQIGGALNFGYYPDDFFKDQPALDLIRPAISLKNLPE